MSLLELKNKCERYKKELSILEGKKEELENQKNKLKEQLKAEGLDNFSDLKIKLEQIKSKYDKIYNELEKQLELL